MNRVLRKGPIGLSLLWLQTARDHHPHKLSHDQAKEDLSSRTSLELRQSARAEFEAMCRDGGPHADRYERVRRQELDFRGDSSEPAFLECAPGPITKATKSTPANSTS